MTKKASQQPDFRRPREFILLIHGIRTDGYWQNKVKKVLEEIESIEVFTPVYGHFDLIRFWCPFWTRRLPIDEVRQEIQKAKFALKNCPDARLSVIAHSFGTYAITEILGKDLDVELHTLVLCGSIVKRDYPWHQLGKRQPTMIINDYGTRDVWPVLAKILTFGYGDTGRHRFGKLEVIDRAHNFKHSDFFEDEPGKGEEFVREFWKPLFETGRCVPSAWDEHAASPYWLKLLSTIPVQWILILIVCAFAWHVMPSTVWPVRPSPEEEQMQFTTHIDLSKLSFDEAIRLRKSAQEPSDWDGIRSKLVNKDVDWIGYFVGLTRDGYIISHQPDGPREPKEEVYVTLRDERDHPKYLKNQSIRVSGRVSRFDSDRIVIVEATIVKN
jgi:hypothetical protein